jgi:hypothetical protein
MPPETEELQESLDQRHIPPPMLSRARKCGEADFFARVSLPLPLLAVMKKKRSGKDLSSWETAQVRLDRVGAGPQ